MGRSFSVPRPEILIEDFARNNSYYHAASDTHYQMLRHGDRIFQRRYQVGEDGRETNVDEKEADYIVGSGNHMRTYVHRNADGTLLQLPLAWYAEKGGYWAMNPASTPPTIPTHSAASATTACSATTPTRGRPPATTASGTSPSIPATFRRNRLPALPRSRRAACHARIDAWHEARCDPRRHRESRATEERLADRRLRAMPSEDH